VKVNLINPINFTFMRCIITLSLPKELCEELEKQMKKYKFSSKSEFMRHIFRFWLERQIDNK